MKKIQRYDPYFYWSAGEYFPDMEPRDDGDYILYEDHEMIVQSLNETIQALRAEIERMQS